MTYKLMTTMANWKEQKYLISTSTFSTPQSFLQSKKQHYYKRSLNCNITILVYQISKLHQYFIFLHFW
jgi:hypothetical protein